MGGLTIRSLAVLVSALGLVAPAMAEGPAVSPGDVLAVVTHEWNGDGGFDRAVLTARDDAVDLWLYLSTGAPDERRLAAHAPGIAWRGAMWGTQPELELTAQDSLQLHSMNEAIGRNRWHEVLTIVWRDDRFVVGGYTRSEIDTLDPEAGYTCDVNLLTGQGVIRDRPFRTALRAVPVDEWNLDFGQLCPEG